MKLLKKIFLIGLLNIGLLQSYLTLANCEDTFLGCLHPQVNKAIKNALIKHKFIATNKTDKWFKQHIYSTVLEFIKKKGDFDKYYIDCSKNELPENEPRTCFGELDSHIAKALWDIDFDYAKASEEQRIDFLKKIGVKLQ